MRGVCVWGGGAAPTLQRPRWEVCGGGGEGRGQAAYRPPPGPPPTSGLTHADQRITEDVEKFCYSISELFSRTVKPLLDVILFTRRYG